jgi:hypothetical protein
MPDPVPETPATPDTVFLFNLPNIEQQISVDVAQIPGELRLAKLQEAVRNYIANAANAATQRYNKAEAEWAAYEEAMKADPLQSAVKKPDGERPAAPNLVDIVVAARQRLYDNKVVRKGEGTGRTRQTVDPLTKTVTKVVQDELFAKRKAENSAYKWPDVVKEVSNGPEYLKARVEEMVASKPEGEQAAFRKELEKIMEDKYLRPARIMLGLEKPKGASDTSLL